MKSKFYGVILFNWKYILVKLFNQASSPTLK